MIVWQRVKLLWIDVVILYLTEKVRYKSIKIVLGKTGPVGGISWVLLVMLKHVNSSC